MPNNKSDKIPYGFLKPSDLPDSDAYDEVRLLPADMTFATTGDFAAVARNHCGAVCASNVLLSLTSRAPEIPSGQPAAGAVFDVMHRIIGNGPVFTLNRGIKKGASAFGKVILSERAASRPDIIYALDRGMPVALLLSNSLFDWHWVLCVGYRRYPLSAGGQTYLRLANSWQPSADVFYLPGEGSRILSGRAYRLG
ncbi:MAG: hypothetical protein J6P87_09375 [Lachnospiraceae bacterium]|nr:hypothetical protein [Lachnospiraceae bacterium]